MTAWVFAEEVDGALSNGSVELLAKARTHDTVSVFYVGTGGDDTWTTLGDHGAARVYHLDPGDTLPSAGAARALAAPGREA